MKHFILAASWLLIFTFATSLSANPRFPFTTIEAEHSENSTSGKTIRMESLPSRTTMTPALEASGRSYVELSKRGEFLTITNLPPSDTLVIRHCIPDAPKGGGISATLTLQINGEFRQKLTLNSRRNWLYGDAGQNGQSNEPDAGVPHVFWDETPFFIEGGIEKGDSLTLLIDGDDTASFYRIDSLDLESVPAPLSAPEKSLSVADFGADGSDEKDDSDAILACIAAAREQNRTVWMPPGTYHQSSKFVLDGVNLRGAGMWHTRLIGTADESGSGFAGLFGFTLTGDGASVSDLFMEPVRIDSRRTPGGKAFTASFGNCKNWTVENVWIAHAHVGFWMSGAHNGVIRGCRIRFSYADGINLNRGSSHNLVENCHVRGTGDDGIAILSETERTPNPSKGNILRKNSVLAVWWGHNMDIAGGSGHLAENNFLADNALFGVFTLNLPNAYPMYPLSDTIVRKNILVRGGGNFAGQRRGAIWTLSSVPVHNVSFEENEIRDSIFRTIHLNGSAEQTLSFSRNHIDSLGQDAIVIHPAAIGAATFKENVVSGLPPDGRYIVHDSEKGTFSVRTEGNSWEVQK